MPCIWATSYVCPELCIIELVVALDCLDGHVEELGINAMLTLQEG
jgi:hypothetical protein